MKKANPTALAFLALLSASALPLVAVHRPPGRVGTPPQDPALVHVGGVDPEDPKVMHLLGVISGPDPCPESPAPNLTPHLHEIGIRSIRNNGYYDDRLDIEAIFQCPGGDTYPSWEGCDPEDESNYYWESSDAQFQSYIDGGFEPFLRLGGEAECHIRHHDFHGPQNAEQEINWIRAALKVADRYLHWGGAEQTFEYLNIWTEWPNADFWDRSAEEFCDFWARAFRAVKEHFGQCKVGGPGFLPSVAVSLMNGERDSAAEMFLNTLYEQGLKPDWIGWHLFTNEPEWYGEAARAYRQLLDGTGPFSDVPWAGTGFFEDVEMIVDAWMVSRYRASEQGFEELPPSEFWELANGALGAAVDTASWIEMQYTEVVRAYEYRCGDPVSSPEDDPESVWIETGLFYGNPEGTPKPRAHAVRLWSMVVDSFPELLQTHVEGGDGKLWALAAASEEGSVALLLANTGDRPIRWEPVFHDAPPAGGIVPITLREVSATNDGSIPVVLTAWPVKLPARAVQLVILGT